MRTLPMGSSTTATRWDGEATVVSVSAEYADAVELCTFPETDGEHRIELPATADGTFGARVEGLLPGTRYGLRVHGPWDPAAGHRHNPNKLLLDPGGKAAVGTMRGGPGLMGHHPGDPAIPSPVDSAPYTMRSVVVDEWFDWEGVGRPGTPLSESIIYETHVKGLTQTHPEVPAELRGTYGGLAHPAVIDYLRDLGVTAVELLPIHQFVQDQHLLETERRNYWGYNSIGFFAPHSEYAAGDDPVREFKTMVRELHRAGLEVILDVVYNHTAEGNHLGPTLCFRGLDNRSWYRLDPTDQSRYLNWSGTGNCVDLTHPNVLSLVMDSLRYWADDMQVDGFRFDLASVLGRTYVDFDPLGGFFGAVAQDPVLRHVKLIAEPWDVGPDGYRVGGYPTRWSEWNDKYRDTVRDFWRGAEGTLGAFATRITGSSDVFGHNRQNPTASVNLVTSHDGFTLTDLVSYDHRHNHANGENNQDGHSDNRSWNSGVEGPTTDPEVVELRARRRRSLLATLLLSQGVPMILGGDEIGRTQGGNNNAYNQDNEISWYDWSTLDPDMFAFTAELIQMRKRHPTFRRTAWLHEHADPGIDHVGWFTPAGKEMTEGDWRAPFARSVALYLRGASFHAGRGTTTDDDFLLMFNGYEESLEFVIPAEIDGGSWEVVVDTADPAQEPTPVIEAVEVASLALTVLRRAR